jgi:ligand-binding sensor domain-containing protein
MMVVICIGGCRVEGGKAESTGALGIESPKLEAWEVPVADVPKLLSRDVRAVAVESGGTVWFGTYGGGVSRYTPKNGMWRTFTTKDGLASNQVQAIAIDKKGAIWFGTRGGGISRYDTESGEWQTILVKDESATNLVKDDLSASEVIAIAVDETGALWIGTSNGTGGSGLSRYDPKGGEWKKFATKDGLADGPVQAIATDGSGALWFGTRGHGVSRYDPKTEAWKTFTTKDGLADNSVQAITVGMDDMLWFGTRGGGVSRYNPKSGEWKTFATKDGLADSSVQAIAVDDAGVLWVGTRGGGVSRHDPKSGAWKTFTTKDGLLDNNVQAIASGSDGAIWFGTLGNGVSRYDPETQVWQMFVAQDIPVYSDVQAIAVDGNGSPWFGAYRGGVSRYDLKSGAWKTFATKDGLADNDVQAIAVGGDGALWLGTCSSGVDRYDLVGDARKMFTTKDGLADNDVYAIAMDGIGALWFGTFGGGVSRYDLKSHVWKKFTTRDGLAANDVRAIAVGSDGVLWFGTFGSGVSRYDPKSGVWKTFTTKDGLTSNDVLAIAEDKKGALWFGAPSSGVKRYDPKSEEWRTFGTKKVFSDSPQQAIAIDGEGALWLKIRGTGLDRMVFDTNEAGALLSLVSLNARGSILLDHGTLIVTRPVGLSYSRSHAMAIALPSFPAGAEVKFMSPGPDNSAWVGTELGGLTLRKPGENLQLTKETGLPSMTVTALAPIPFDNSKIWVGTSGGAALVGIHSHELRVERTLAWEGMPTGPVDALTAMKDGSIFLAYNALPADRFLESKIAERRSRTRVWYVSRDGLLEEIQSTEAFARSEIRTLVFSEKHGLWAGTSAGLFVAAKKQNDAGTAELETAGFEPVTGQGHLTPAPIRKLVTAPDAFETLWMSVDKQGDTPPFLVGFRPGTGWVYNLTQERGIPSGDVIDDLTFTDEGELVVMVGSRLAKGNAFVPVTPIPANTPSWFWIFVVLGGFLTGAGGTAYALSRNSLARRLRRNPENLRSLPLAAIPGAFKVLRDIGELEEVWTQLDLPTQTLPLVEPLASSAPAGAPQFRALAELLGMASADAAAAEITLFPHGLSLLSAHLTYPVPLRGHPIAFVAFDLVEARRADPARVRETLESALKQAGHRFELPYLLLADGEVADDILPTSLAGLHLGEAERKDLLFAHSPAYTLAGMLHTRGLLALSPYGTSGSVTEEQMFFGRSALLRELLLASSVQQIIVGPRRVGKTSLLKNLLRELPGHRPDTEVFFLDLLGIADSNKAAGSLARQLKIEISKDADPDTALVDLLRSRFDGAAKKGVILIDEADGLVETDAKRGFPLLKAMRTLQAEGHCSFVLAGYLYLYREAMNQSSPLYNFATLRLLGPLDSDAARDLALVPMLRLGVTYADPSLPARIAERTGGYPSFVQLLCDALLKELKGGDLTLTAVHVAHAERSPRVSGELGDMFRLNAGKITQIAVYGLLDRDSFTSADAEEALKRALGSAVPKGAVEQALLELRIFGFAVAEEGRYTWAIPLLRETLQAADPQVASARLVEELSEKPEA